MHRGCAPVQRAVVLSESAMYKSHGGGWGAAEQAAFTNKIGREGGWGD